MFFKKSNLFYKIFGTYVIIILLGMMVVGFLVGRQVKTRLMERIEYDLTTYAQMIKQISSESKITKNVAQLAKISDTRVTLIDATGKVLADSDKEELRVTSDWRDRLSKYDNP
ncbi:MAG: hypothetical protein B1H13_13220 [Desulfobacteraceae bacterium 4484_190.3]|nr:MAG: hypothetical protein B1H13_13220 [Desulfobacteraceae bacterium 4484_190.3]